MNGSIEQDELLKLVVDSLYLAIVVDETTRIRYLSQKYADIIGVDRHAAIGLPVEQVIPNTRLPHVIKTGKEEIGQLFMMRNGEMTICNRFPIYDKDGTIRGALSSASFHSLDHVQELNSKIINLNKEVKSYRRKLSEIKQSSFDIDSIIGQDPVIQKVKRAIGKMADSNLSVLVIGETGTGKEVFANAIHQLSSRRFEHFVKINCAAIPKDLLESELFGYSEGAFSGASKGGKIGKLEYANRGTILLDEIGDMPLPLQTKLLRVLQEKELERIGSNQTIKLDTRIICCTNQDIGLLVRKGQFREDLYYRINIVEIKIPPLRERVTDIKLLCDYFIHKINLYHGCAITGISDSMLERFESYQWPGNVRELEHVLERACVFTTHGMLEAEHFDFFLPRFFQEKIIDREPQPTPEKGSLSNIKNQSERSALINALEKTGGNKSKAAELLNISRTQFYEKLKKYGIC